MNNDTQEENDALPSTSMFTHIIQKEIHKLSLVKLECLHVAPQVKFSTCLRLH